MDEIGVRMKYVNKDILEIIELLVCFYLGYEGEYVNVWLEFVENLVRMVVLNFGMKGIGEGEICMCIFVLGFCLLVSSWVIFLCICLIWRFFLFCNNLMCVIVSFSNVLL